MNPNRSEVEKVDWCDLAGNITVKLLEALDQLTKDSQGRSISLANNDLNKLVKRRLVTIGQLKTVLESFSVPDLVDIAAESQITNIVLVDELLQERNELGLLKENLVSNVGNLGDLLTNRNQRDENLIKIVQGLRQETEAIEDENDEEEFQKLRRMRNDIRAVLNTILDEAYPEMKTDVKKIIQALYEVKEKEDNYIQVPDNVDAQAINLLLTANIIKYHETEPQLISLMF